MEPPTTASNTTASGEVLLYSPEIHEWCMEKVWGKPRLLNGVAREVE